MIDSGGQIYKKLQELDKKIFICKFLTIFPGVIKGTCFLSSIQ